MLDKMDIDGDDTPQSNEPQPSAKRLVVAVDDAHTFDLDGYISNYTGRTAVDRLIHIITICPQIAPQALHLAVQHIHQLRDPMLYRTAVLAYEQLRSHTDLPPASDIATLDPRWEEEITTKNLADRAKLDVELKTYSNSMIKESIRMAHRELGNFYYAIGDNGTALKHFTKTREFCTTGQHVLDMCLSILELLIEQRNYAHISTYVFKAETALDAANSLNANASNNTSPISAHPPNGTKKSPEREKVQAKLRFATALSHLGQGSYEKAAMGFLNLGPVTQLEDWIGKIVATGDIAIYGTLCALSRLPRSGIKSRILENSSFVAYIEQEPYVRELVEAYTKSNFKTVLELLSQYSTRHYVDLHLASHVHNITNLIRDSAVVLYFQPFATIKLERMSAAFGWTIDEVERHVVALIQSGDIKGRVDSQNKILQAKKTDYRAELFARAIQAVADMQNTNRKLLLRMRLQQADLIIRSPRASQHESFSEMLQVD